MIITFKHFWKSYDKLLFCFALVSCGVHHLASNPSRQDIGIAINTIGVADTVATTDTKMVDYGGTVKFSTGALGHIEHPSCGPFFFFLDSLGNSLLDEDRPGNIRDSLFVELDGKKYYSGKGTGRLPNRLFGIRMTKRREFSPEMRDSYRSCMQFVYYNRTDEVLEDSFVINAARAGTYKVHILKKGYSDYRITVNGRSCNSQIVKIHDGEVFFSDLTKEDCSPLTAETIALCRQREQKKNIPIVIPHDTTHKQELLSADSLLSLKKKYPLIQARHSSEMCIIFALDSMGRDLLSPHTIGSVFDDTYIIHNSNILGKNSKISRTERAEGMGIQYFLELCDTNFSKIEERDRYRDYFSTCLMYISPDYFILDIDESFVLHLGRLGDFNIHVTKEALKELDGVKTFVNGAETGYRVFIVEGGAPARRALAPGRNRVLKEDYWPESSIKQAQQP